MNWKYLDCNVFSEFAEYVKEKVNYLADNFEGGAEEIVGILQEEGINSGLLLDIIAPNELDEFYDMYEGEICSLIDYECGFTDFDVNITFADFEEMDTYDKKCGMTRCALIIMVHCLANLSGIGNKKKSRLSREDIELLREFLRTNFIVCTQEDIEKLFDINKLEETLAFFLESIGSKSDDENKEE